MKVLVENRARKAANKALYKKALEDRKRKKMQNICYKILLVGKYWSDQSAQR